MTINVVVVDGGKLPEGVEFPPLEAAKYGWEQYLQLENDDIAERCWRADILVALSSAIIRANLVKMPRLKLLITAGEACRRLDQAAAQQQGVEFLAFPHAEYGEAGKAQDICDRISKEPLINSPANAGIQGIENSGSRHSPG